MNTDISYIYSCGAEIILYHLRVTQIWMEYCLLATSFLSAVWACHQSPLGVSGEDEVDEHAGDPTKAQLGSVDVSVRVCAVYLKSERT